jgi:hypothetical protein
MEWNQPPHPKRMVRKPVVLVGEVIQIGAAKVDESLEVIDTFKAMVAPQFYTKMHKHVTRVTGLTNDDIAAGLPFDALHAVGNLAAGLLIVPLRDLLIRLEKM